VRREWLKTFVARKAPPKDALGFILSELADGDFELREGMSSQHKFARDLLDLPEAPVRWQRRKGENDAIASALAAASTDRSQVIALALVLGAHESITDVHLWRRPTEGAARYLAKLGEWGYELSEIEQSVIDSGSGPDDEDDEG
jgi:ParB family chromosome partitioning protein